DGLVRRLAHALDAVVTLLALRALGCHRSLRVKNSVSEKATSIPAAGAPPGPPARRSGSRGARYPSRRARRHAPLSRCASCAGTGSSPGRIRACAPSCRIPVLVVVVLGQHAALAQILALVGGEAVVERLQADAEHVGGLPLRAALGKRRLDQPPAHLLERAAHAHRKE